MDMQSRKSVKFLCNDWLDITEGDGTIMRNIRPATPDDFNDFDFVFQVMVLSLYYLTPWNFRTL